MKITGLAALALAAAPLATAAALPPEHRLTISATDHGFVPHRVNIVHGAPYAIRLVNPTGRKHDLKAPDFFIAAALDGRTAALVHDGKVDLEPGQEVTLHFLAPRGPGRFPFKSSQLADAASGLSGYFIIR